MMKFNVVKKIYSLLLIGLLAIGLAACGDTVTCETDYELIDGSCVLINVDAPVIVGAESMTIIVGDTFDPTSGITATDTEDGDITSSITIEGTVDVSVPSDYELVYTIVDSGGLSTTETITISVELPNEFPVVTIDDDIVIYIGDTLDLTEGVSSSDTEDGDLTSAITFVDTVNVSVAGDYVVAYSSIDSDGDETLANRNVYVLDPASDPVILGADDETVYQGRPFDELESVLANDLEDGDITLSIVVSGTYDISVIGVYTITYTITDSDGIIISLDRVITVVEDPDPVPPVILGAEDFSVFEGDTYVPLAGITATDDVSGDITDRITVVGEVDLAVEGTYVITVSVTDDAYNTTTVTYNVSVYLRVRTNEEKAALDMSLIDIGDDLELPAYGPNGSFYYWSSDNPSVISNRGYIVPPPVGSDPVTVTLTATVINSSYVTSFSIEVVVQPNPEVIVTSNVELPFVGTSDEYVVPNQDLVDLYFVDNGAVPYIDIETFLDLINGALESDIISYTPIGDDILEITYEIEYEDFDGLLYTEYYVASVNFTENTFTVNTFDFFEGYIASTSSDYGSGLVYVDAYFKDGNEVVIPLGFYNFDLVTYEDEGETQYLMPFHVANLIFAGGVYYDVYYNGDTLYGIDTFGISGGSAEDLALQDTIRTSSLNTEDAPKDVKIASYNFMVLALDYFYGLKEDQGVETYYDNFSVQAENYFEDGDLSLYRRIFNIAYGLDDLHTSHVFPGYYEAPYGLGLSLSNLGPSSVSFYEGLWAVQDLLEAKYGSVAAMPDHEVLSDGITAVIHLTGFSIDTPDEFKAFLDGLDPAIENVVIDLAYNTGGNLGAVLRIFGYMTEETFMYHSQNPADGSAVTYYIESDYVAYDYNWYIVSSSVTFSAANLMVSIAKEQGIATILGQDSSGGASSIGVILTPDGSGLLISTNNVLSTRTGNEIDGYEYFSIENGIEVEYYMSDVYSDQQIMDKIFQHQNE